MDRFEEIKDKFKDLGVLAGADVVWLFVKIKDLQQKNEFLEKAHKANIKNQYKSLVESQAGVLECFIGDIEDYPIYSVKRKQIKITEVTHET